MPAGVNIWIGEDLATLVSALAIEIEPSDFPLRPRTVVVPNQSVGQWLEQRWASATGQLHRGVGGVAANLDVIFASTFIARTLYNDDAELAAWTVEGLTGQLLKTRSHVGELSVAQAANRARNLHEVIHLRPDDVADYLARDDNARERTILGTQQVRAPWSPWQRLAEFNPGACDVNGDVIVFGCNDLSAGSLLAHVVAALGAQHRVDVYLSTPVLDTLRRHLNDAVTPSLATRWAADNLTHLATWLEVCATSPPTWLPRETSGHPDRERVRTLVEGGELDSGLAVRTTPWLEVHGAVGAFRQVEIARDALLRAMDELDVAPHDVRVVTTDAARFVALMRVVWNARDHGPTPGPELQFEVSDPSLARASDRLRGFRQLLRVVDSHFTVHDVVALVSEPALQVGLALDRDAVERLIELADGGVSLGLNGALRAELGVFAADDDAGSWERFIDRGMLSAVYELDESPRSNVIRPLGVPDDLHVMAGLAHLVQRLCDARRDIATSRAMGEWLTLFDEWSDLIGRPEDVIDNGLERVVDRLRGQLLPQDVAISFCEMRDLVSDAAAALGGGSVLGRGGVIVQDVNALRDAPFRITCLIGLDEDLTPSPLSPPAHLGPARSGDPSARNRFRSALLSTILTTSERVIITTNDRSVRDNAPVPRALPLAELDDVFTRGGLTMTARSHPRHAFSTSIADSSAGVEPDVDDVAIPFSMDPSTATLATQLYNRAAPSFDDDVALRTFDFTRDVSSSALDLGTLVQFVKNPQRIFLQTMMSGASLPSRQPELPDTPRLEIGDSLERWSLRNSLVERALRDGVKPSLDLHPDGALSSVATGLRVRASVELDVEGLGVFVERYLADLGAIRATRVSESCTARVVWSDPHGRSLTRPAINLYESNVGPLVIDWTVSSRFTSTYYALLLEITAATLEYGRAVAGVLVRPAVKKDGGFPGNPYLMMRWRGDDAVGAAARAIGVVADLYDRRVHEVPIHFFRTSMAGAEHPGLKKLLEAHAASSWDSPRYAYSAPGERFDDVNRVLFPFDFDELRELRDGVFDRRSAQLRSAFDDVEVTVSSVKSAVWTHVWGGDDGGL